MTALQRILSFLLILMLLISLSFVYFTHSAYADCVEGPNDTWNCTDDADGADTTGNGGTDIVNLNGATINNIAGGLDGIVATNVTVNGAGIVDGNFNGIFATGNVTVNGADIAGAIGSGIFAIGNVDVTGGSVTSDVTIAILSFGNVTTNDVTVTSDAFDGIRANGNVTVIDGSVWGFINGIETTDGRVGISQLVFVDSADVTGGTAAIDLNAGDDVMILTNNTANPIITGVMDGGADSDLAVGIEAPNSLPGAYVERNFDCTTTPALCSGVPITAVYQGNSYTINNFEAVTVFNWKPF